MGVVFETGYSLPSGDKPLTHARIAHARNWLAGGTATASSTATDYIEAAPTTSLTAEKWRPASVPATWQYDHSAVLTGLTVTNIWTFSDQFDNAAWIKNLATVTADATTAPDGTATADKLVETAATGGHFVSQAFDPDLNATYTITVYAKAAERQFLQLVFTNDAFGTNIVGAFALSGAGSAAASADGTVSIKSIGSGWYRCSLTALSDVDDVSTSPQIRLATSLTTTADSYAGDGTSGLHIWRGNLTASDEVLPAVQTTTVAATAGYGQIDYCCIGAHTMGTEGAAFTVQYFDGAWIDLSPATNPTDDMDAMAIFAPVYASLMRVSITTAAANIGVIKFGLALQMEQEIWGEFTPPRYNRRTEVNTNRSTTGEFLGLTKISTTLAATFSWAELSESWVDTYWPDFQRAIETEPFFIAWRPGDEDEVSLCYAANSPAPRFTGQIDYMAVSLQAAVRAWD